MSNVDMAINNEDVLLVSSSNDISISSFVEMNGDVLQINISTPSGNICFRDDEVDDFLEMFRQLLIVSDERKLCE